LNIIGKLSLTRKQLMISLHGYIVQPQMILYKLKHEPQLMLTNPRDAFRDQSRSQNMVPFDMLGMVSY